MVNSDNNLVAYHAHLHFLHRYSLSVAAIRNEELVSNRRLSFNSSLFFSSLKIFEYLDLFHMTFVFNLLKDCLPNQVLSFFFFCFIWTTSQSEEHQIHGRVVFAASLGDFKNALHAAQCGFALPLGLVVLFTCAKPCRRQLRCDRNAVNAFRLENVQECVCLIAGTLFVWMPFGERIDYLFTAGMQDPAECWVSVGSRWVRLSLHFKVTTAARAGRWNLSLAGSKEQTEEFLSHQMKTRWHPRVP